MPVETVLVLTGVLVTFVAFALVLAYVNHIAGGSGDQARRSAVASHVSGRAVRRADTAPDLIRRKEGHDDLTESHSTVH